MNTIMTGFRWFSKIFAYFVLWANVASALEGLKSYVALMRRKESDASINFLSRVTLKWLAGQSS